MSEGGQSIVFATRR